MGRWTQPVLSVVLLVGGLTACGDPDAGTTNAAYTDLCGTRVGMNMLVVDATSTTPVTVDGTTAGDVVALRVAASCAEGVDVALDPATGSGVVRQVVRDGRHRVVGLVLVPVPGAVLHVYRTDLTPRRLLATVDIPRATAG